jgi:hypothetical protein
LYRSGAVLDEQTTEDGNLHLTLMADDALLAQLQKSKDVRLHRYNRDPKLSSTIN